MRYHEIIVTHAKDPEARLRTVTLYVPRHEWQRLTAIRQVYGPTRVTARRALAPQFPGHSVDVECSSPDVASKLLGAWTKGSGRS
jgi:hypothetical protein